LPSDQLAACCIPGEIRALKPYKDSVLNFAFAIQKIQCPDLLERLPKAWGARFGFDCVEADSHGSIHGRRPLWNSLFAGLYA
jgi:hypothetical protein